MCVCVLTFDMDKGNTDDDEGISLQQQPAAVCSFEQLRYLGVFWGDGARKTTFSYEIRTVQGRARQQQHQLFFSPPPKDKQRRMGTQSRRRGGNSSLLLRQPIPMTDPGKRKHAGAGGVVVVSGSLTLLHTRKGSHAFSPGHELELFATQGAFRGGDGFVVMYQEFGEQSALAVVLGKLKSVYKVKERFERNQFESKHQDMDY